MPEMAHDPEMRASAATCTPSEAAGSRISLNRSKDLEMIVRCIIGGDQEIQNRDRGRKERHAWPASPSSATSASPSVMPRRDTTSLPTFSVCRSFPATTTPPPTSGWTNTPTVWSCARTAAMTSSSSAGRCPILPPFSTSRSILRSRRLGDRARGNGPALCERAGDSLVLDLNAVNARARHLDGTRSKERSYYYDSP